ncbi:MAG: hypothetical protein ACLFPA_07755 [Dichotomicrobium sp.]
MLKGLSSVCAALLVAAGFAGAAAAAATQGPAMSPLPERDSGVTTAENGVQVADAGDFGAGLAVGIIGSIIAHGAAEAHRDRYHGDSYDDEEWRWRKCDREFRSFEWDTGMYTTYSGHRRLCPYLR